MQRLLSFLFVPLPVKTIKSLSDLAKAEMAGLALRSTEPVFLRVLKSYLNFSLVLADL